MIRTKTEIVYENIHKFFTYRGYVAEGKISTEDFKKQINLNSYYTQRADKCCVIITRAKSDSESKSDIVRGLIRSAINSKPGLESVIFVTSEPANSNVRKVIQSFGSHVENFQYNMFLSEKPRHIAMPRHEFATDAEIAEIRAITNTEMREMPRIFNTDPGVVWLGARIGDIVKVTAPSDTAGESIVYLIVVPESAIAQDIEEVEE